MHAKDATFLEIFRARNPLDTEGFRHLRADAAAAARSPVLREFFLALNEDLRARLAAPGDTDLGWVAALCVALAEAGPEATAEALADLLDDTSLPVHEPLVSVVFEAASQAPALLAVVGGFVEAESRLLQARVRAIEALVTKAPGGIDAGAVGLEAQPALRFLNSVLEEQARGPGAIADSPGRWSEEFKGLSRLFREGEDPQVLEWSAEALGRLGESPQAPETLRVILRILRSNTPLPAWHPAAPRRTPDARGPDGVGALIVDKALQVVLAAAAAAWPSRPAGRPVPTTVDLWPFHERVLAAALLDTARPPRERAAAAALSRVLQHAAPAVQLSPEAEVYAELLLTPYWRGEPEVGAALDAEARLDVLIDAVADACGTVRRTAAEACCRAALADPVRFQPRHYTKLLPLLSDDDAAIRASAMKTFQALAGFRTGKLAAVVDDISARLQGPADAGGEGQRARRDLEAALGITMDRLVADVEQLEREVQGLEARRRELLQYMETEAVRVGEEIHHEVLNTLTGHLATAIDEEDYRDAKRGLDALVAELRRIMNNLYPRDLETQGFVATIRNRLRDAERLLARRGPGSRARLECGPEVTDDAIQACLAEPSHLVLLYRIVLEAISNARKHARGTVIEVSMRVPSPGAIEISVSDNGAGDGGPFTESTGMALMRRRAEEIGAEIEYQRAPGQGTAVVVRLGGPQSGGGAGTEAVPDRPALPESGG